MALPHPLDEFREQIANAIAMFKSYDVPEFLVRLGLRLFEEPAKDATHQTAQVEQAKAEAHMGKSRFVLKRLPLDEAALMKIADTALQAIKGGNYELEEELWKRKERSKRSRMTEVTRRAVLDNLVLRFTVQSIGGKLDIVELIGRNWPLETMTSTDPRYADASGDFLQHLVLNNDWNLPEVFERLGLLRCSERRFFGLLEQLVHPVTRDTDDQAELIAALNLHLAADGLELREFDRLSNRPVFQVESKRFGVSGRPKNIIFGANGPKPEILLIDALNNDVEIVKNAEYCLVYDEQMGPNGLSWGDLISWWAAAKQLDPSDRSTQDSLYRRLDSSLASPPEHVLFRAYYGEFIPKMKMRAPALIPQVYLHLDPLVRRKELKVLSRQRMDFLLLLSARDRIVIEVDGKQHYADGERASPSRYAEMVAADRDLQLAGYSVFRFGGAELDENDGPARAVTFFRELMERFGVALS